MVALVYLPSRHADPCYLRTRNFPRDPSDDGGELLLFRSRSLRRRRELYRCLAGIRTVLRADILDSVAGYPESGIRFNSVPIGCCSTIGMYPHGPAVLLVESKGFRDPNGTRVGPVVPARLRSPGLLIPVLSCRKPSSR